MDTDSLSRAFRSALICVHLCPSVGNSCRASSSAISDRHGGKKMLGKKMKIGSGAIATPTSFLAGPIFLPHIFLPSMQWRKSLDSASPDSQRPRRPVISRVDGTNANHWIGPSMLRSNHRPRRSRASIRPRNFFHARTVAISRHERTSH